MNVHTKFYSEYGAKLHLIEKAKRSDEVKKEEELWTSKNSDLAF